MNEYEYIKNVVMFVFGIIIIFFNFIFLVMFAILSVNIKGHLLERLAHGVVTAGVLSLPATLNQVSDAI